MSRRRLVEEVLPGVKAIFRHHFLHHALKRSILDNIQEPNGVLVPPPIVFSGVGRHDSYEQQESQKLSKEQIQILAHADLLRARASICIRVWSAEAKQHGGGLHLDRE
jgi:hypothetical protein